MTNEEIQAMLKTMLATALPEAIKTLGQGEELKTSINGVVNPIIEQAIGKLKEEQNKFTSSLVTPANKAEQKMAEAEKDVEELIKALLQANPHKQNDSRALQKIQEAGKFKTISGLSGTLIPTEYSSTIHSMLDKNGVARRDCTIIPMNSETLKNPIFLTQLEMDFVDSTTRVKPDKLAQFTSGDLTAKELALIIAMKDEDVMNSIINLPAFLRPQIANAWLRAEDRAFFFGNTGATVNGLYQTAVEYRPIAAISALTASHLLEMQSRVNALALEGSKYYLSRSVFNLIRGLKDTTGQFIYQKPSEMTPGTIWDMPFEIVNMMPSTGASLTTDPAFVFFGNPKYFLIGDRTEITFATSTEATVVDYLGNTINLFQKNQTALKAFVWEAFLQLFNDSFCQLRVTGGSS